MAKRRKLPEEDLEAAVAEMLASPITRANLNFLKPEFAAETSPIAAGLQPLPIGSDSSPAAAGPIPTPFGAEPPGVDITPPVVESQPGGYQTRPLGVDIKARGVGAPTSSPPRPQAWVAEHLGSVFDVRRVRPIERATDALSAVELSVYRLFWSQQSGAVAAGPSRLAQFSLNRIAIETKVNIKTVRELLPRLTEKGFIEVAVDADAKLGLPATYRVWSEQTLLERMRVSGRQWVVRTGKGVFYAHPAGEPPAEAMKASPTGRDTSPLVAESRPTGVDESPVEAIAAICRAEFGIEPGAAELSALIEECRQRAHASGSVISGPELLYFAESKARVIARASNIRNHFAVWRKALPECFARSR